CTSRKTSPTNDAGSLPPVPIVPRTADAVISHAFSNTAQSCSRDIPTSICISLGRVFPWLHHPWFATPGYLSRDWRHAYVPCVAGSILDTAGAPVHRRTGQRTGRMDV